MASESEVDPETADKYNWEEATRTEYENESNVLSIDKSYEFFTSVELEETKKVFKNDTSTSTEIRRFIKHGRTLDDHSLLDLIQMQKFLLVCGIKIENWTKYTLQEQKLIIISGGISCLPIDIGTMQVEAIIAHKKTGLSGTTGLVSFKVGCSDVRVVVLWSVSLFSSNTLSVGITTECPDKSWFNKILKNIKINNSEFKTRHYKDEIDTVCVEYKDYVIAGVMGTGSKAEVQIIVKPANSDNMP